MPTVDKKVSISIKQGLILTKTLASHPQQPADRRTAAHRPADTAVQHDQMLKHTGREVMKW
ncbi:hypothetical protein [Acidovorax carolinensis]|uniref:hypothetical protein n=1 Tax=Acidovorax carolinensis TaxID=553814 RepID=UPI0012FF9475|nr:hypothetical protein [Acidovorax carolinensis]